MYHLTQTVFWLTVFTQEKEEKTHHCLPLIFQPRPEVTRDWSKRAFGMQTFSGL